MTKIVFERALAAQQEAIKKAQAYADAAAHEELVEEYVFNAAQLAYYSTLWRESAETPIRNLRHLGEMMRAVDLDSVPEGPVRTVLEYVDFIIHRIEE